jgi:hypothetical protein
MSDMGSNDTANRNAPAEQAEGASPGADEKRLAEQRKSDHRDQIRAMARAAVQAMVTSNRNK